MATLDQTRGRVRPIEIRDNIAAAMAYRGPEAVVEGPRGSGKTVGILLDMYRCACAYAGSRQLICRSSRSRLTETALVTLEEEILGPGHPVRMGPTRAGRHEYIINAGTHRESKIGVGGLDDISRLLSSPWDRIYVNEVTEIEESVWDELGGALRWNHMPWQQKLGDCNPATPANWANQRADHFDDKLRPRLPSVESIGDVLTRERYQAFTDFNLAPLADRCKRIVTCHLDNPHYWDFDRWQWTPAGLSYCGDQLAKMGGHRRRRFFEGIWTSAEGSVFPEFDEEKHVIQPFNVPKHWPCYLAEDPGRDHPTAIVVACVAPDETLFIVAEIVRRQTTNEQDTKAISSLCENFNIIKKLGDPHMMFSATKFHPTGKTIAQQLADFGHNFTRAPAARNQAEIAQQVEMIRTRLTTIASGGPKLQVFKTCPCVIRGFQSWSYVRDRQGRMSGGEDRFEDVNDDEMDCVRMIVASNPTYKPGGEWGMSGGIVILGSADARRRSELQGLDDEDGVYHCYPARPRSRM